MGARILDFRFWIKELKFNLKDALYAQRLVEKPCRRLYAALSSIQDPKLNCSMPHAQYNSWRGCALSVAMPQALRLLYQTLLRSLSTSAQCPMPNAQCLKVISHFPYTRKGLDCITTLNS